MPKRLLDDDASSDASTPDPTTDTCLPCDDQDQEVADDPYPFACDQPGCAKKCKAQPGLSTHKKRVHKIAVYHTCDLCDFKAKTVANLKAHKASKHGIDVVWHACNQPGCDFKAKQASSLKVHKANKHDIGVVWYACDEHGCDFKAKGFNSSLKSHKANIHGIDVVWHACDQSNCEYKGKHAGGLKQHKVNVHDIGVVWHLCDANPVNCDYKCKQSDNLQKHIRSVHARVYAQRKKAQEERVRSALLAAGWKEYTLAETMPPVGFFRREKRIDFKCAKLESRTTWCRIDFVLGVPNGYIFLEVDEDQHKFGYGDELSCDMKRMACVMESLAVETEYNLPNLYWLRYNPNAWRVDGDLCIISKVEREARLVAWLSSFECVNQFGIGYAFYDCEAADEDGAPGRLCVLENTEYNPQYASAVENLAGMQAK